MESIYDLKLHESITIEEGLKTGRKTRITRVPGGWVYMDRGIHMSANSGSSLTQTSTFVPYNEEFKPKES